MWGSILLIVIIVLSGFIPAYFKSNETCWEIMLLILSFQNCLLSFYLFKWSSFYESGKKAALFFLFSYEAICFINILISIVWGISIAGFVLYLALSMTILFVAASLFKKNKVTLDKKKTMILRKEPDSIFHLFLKGFSFGSISIYHNNFWYGFKHGEFVKLDNFEENKYSCEKYLEDYDLSSYLDHKVGEKWSLTNNCWSMVNDIERFKYGHNNR